jgi:predicted dithiol-disulfide oxidoreductase (DUF899 family)
LIARKRLLVKEKELTRQPSGTEGARDELGTAPR